jgi:cytochrome b subunit of formate dehydrogenase
VEKTGRTSREDAGRHNRLRDWRSGWIAAAAAAAIVVCFGLALAQQELGETYEDPDGCLMCHGEEGSTEEAPPFVGAQAFAKSAHVNLGCSSCHIGFDEMPHDLTKVTQLACESCHSPEAEEYIASVHNQTSPGHPDCSFCHQKNAHEIRAAASVTQKERLALCSECHGNEELMGRYGVDPGAVLSYNRSFHGKAFRYGLARAAVCTDCHGYHLIPAVGAADSPVSPANIKEACARCHHGAAPGFALCGVNHLDLRLRDSTTLRVEKVFFQYLVWIVLAVLGVWVLLDLRASVALVLRRRREPKPPSRGRPERTRLWFTPWQRIQHWVFAVSFIVLALSGLPLRLADSPVLQGLYGLMGGIGVARVLHRAAGAVMLATAIVHLVYLLWTWRRIGYSFRRIPMLPNRHDWRDLVATVKYYFGLRRVPPKLDRFSFRSKFGYWAVFWGLPIIFLSGLVLWFPVPLGNWLGSLAIPVAYIAHSDEAVLAIGAVIVWHIYITFFSQTYLPWAPKMLRVRLTEEEVQREHGKRVAG